jgi:LmbE family N-acetylglucosaminyl deacetylase
MLCCSASLISMPTDPLHRRDVASTSQPSASPVDLYLFAHQDDEMGVFESLFRARAAGHRVVVVYLTNGNWGGVAPQVRNAESTRVLTALGLELADVHFSGTILGIADGTLPDHMPAALDAVEQIARLYAPIRRVVTLAWEGGHQDHDATHAIGVATAVRLGVLSTSRQFTLYRAPLSGRWPYVMFQPLAANGAVERIPIPWRRRLQHVRRCFEYRTQAKAMLGLLPFMAADYIWTGCQTLQPLSLDRLRERPHEGALLYERRGRSTFDYVSTRVNALLNFNKSSTWA